MPDYASLYHFLLVSVFRGWRFSCFLLCVMVIKPVNFFFQPLIVEIRISHKLLHYRFGGVAPSHDAADLIVTSSSYPAVKRQETC